MKQKQANALKKRLATNLSMYRTARRNSLVAFSQELDISRSQLQAYLKGTGNPTLGIIEDMAKNLDVPPHSLLAGPEAAIQACVSQLSEQDKMDLERALLILLAFLESSKSLSKSCSKQEE
ncbi:XRE family transcriptional regulator [Clostridiales bacterium]|nr:XRE family transcriptional regulator [Clostridiales bacterium]